MTNTFLCPSVIQGCGIRLTDIDQWGITIDPLVEQSRIFTSGWIETTITPISFQRGAVPVGGDNEGEACIVDYDQPKLVRFDISVKLCGFPSPVFEKLLGASLVEDPNTVGEFRGLILKDSHRQCCADTVMFEIITKNGDGCDPACAYTQWIFPLTRNWEMASSFTFQNGTTEFTLQAQAEANPNFFPSLPGPTLPSYTADGVPEGPAPAIIPINPNTGNAYIADIFTQSDVDEIRAGGPLSVWCLPELPDGIDDCGYMGNVAAPSIIFPIAVDDAFSCEVE